MPEFLSKLFVGKFLNQASLIPLFLSMYNREGNSIALNVLSDVQTDYCNPSAVTVARSSTVITFRMKSSIAK